MSFVRWRLAFCASIVTRSCSYCACGIFLISKSFSGFHESNISVSLKASHRGNTPGNVLKASVLHANLIPTCRDSLWVSILGAKYSSCKRFLLASTAFTLTKYRGGESVFRVKEIRNEHLPVSFSGARYTANDPEPSQN